MVGNFRRSTTEFGHLFFFHEIFCGWKDQPQNLVIYYFFTSLFVVGNTGQNRDLTFFSNELENFEQDGEEKFCEKIFYRGPLLSPHWVRHFYPPSQGLIDQPQIFFVSEHFCKIILWLEWTRIIFQLCSTSAWEKKILKNLDTPPMIFFQKFFWTKKKKI